MAEFTAEANRTLKSALDAANDRQHEYATLEHLLLALIDDEDVAQVFEAKGINSDGLRDDVFRYLNNELEALKTPNADSAPTAGFQRVIQRAVLGADNNDTAYVNGAGILQALFSEKDSYAVYFLDRAGLRAQSVDFASFVKSGESSTESLQNPGATEALIDSSLWTGQPSKIALSEANRERLVALLRDAEQNLDAAGIGNSEKAQALAFLVAARTLAEAPDPPVDLIWEMINRAAAIAGIAGLFIAILALFK